MTARRLAIFLTSALATTLTAQAELVPAAEHEKSGAVRISFVPPDLEGRFVLGIFNADGNLVRTLTENQYQTDFTLGRDGLMTEWDGLNDRGEACAPGPYSARGMVIGDLRVNGEAYYFNDWVAQDGVRVLEVAGTESLPEGGFGIRVRLPDGSLRSVEVNTEGALNWARPEPGDQDKLAEPDSPKDPLVIASTPGRNDTTWRVVRESEARDAAIRIVQTDPEGIPLREMNIPKGEMQPRSIRASKIDDAILLEESKAGSSRVRLLRRTGNAEAAAEPDAAGSDWEIVFERKLDAIRDFGFVDNEVVPFDGSGKSELEVRLVPNSLSPEPESVNMIAQISSDGTRLVMENGLRIARVGTGSAWQNVYIAPGQQPGTARLIQGDGIVVEEYALTGLDQIALFDAGSFEIGGNNDGH